jgi:predicted nuclease of predicted toxin-antitoxin system
MKFILDAQLPPALCIWLNGKGHNAKHVYDLGLGAATDHVIAERTIADEAYLISKDEDFLFLRLPDRFGFVWLRVGNATTRHLISWLEARWDQVEALLKSGERLIELR